MAEATRAFLIGERDAGESGVEFHVKFVNEDGDEVELGSADTTVITGYEIGTAAALAETDTLLEALGKLEARIVELETP